MELVILTKFDKDWPKSVKILLIDQFCVSLDFFLIIIYFSINKIHFFSNFRYVADMSRQRAESLLKSEDKEGCFVVRNSSQKGLYTLSLFTKVPQSQVKHYHIKQNTHGFFLSEKHCCNTIPELIEYHSYNAGGLACRLKCPPGRSKPPTAGLSHGKWEIDPTELTLLEELGKDYFTN